MEGLRSCVGCRKVYLGGLEWKHRGCVVVHAPEIGSSQAASGSSQPSQMVVHKAGGGSSRHGVYASPEKRREYRRLWMRAKRAEARKGV